MELKFKGNKKQEECFELLVNGPEGLSSIGYGGGAGGGKTFLGIFWTWVMCTMYPGVRYFWGRNELKNLKASTYVSYGEFLEAYNVPEAQQGTYREKDSEIVFQNGSVIKLLDLFYRPSDRLGTKFGSQLYTGGLIEQSEEVNIKVINTVYTRIGRWKNLQYNIPPRILEVFNPAKNHVFSRFYKPDRDGNLKEHRVFIRALVTDWLEQPEYFFKHMKVHSSEEKTWYGIYIKQLMTASDPEDLERLLFGNFEYDNDPSRIINYEALDDLFTNSFVSGGLKYITADIAAYGADKLVIAVWDGLKVIELIVRDKCTPSEIVEILNQKRNQYRVPKGRVIYDSDGMGQWLRDKEYFGGVSFVGNGKVIKVGAKTENFLNLRSQCYYKLAHTINNYDMWIPEEVAGIHIEEIKEELEQIKTFESEKDTKKRITPKEKIKAVLGRSPDFSDTLMMRMLPQIKPKKSDYR